MPDSATSKLGSAASRRVEASRTPQTPLWRLAVDNCPDGWRSTRSLVPSPYIALAARADLVMMRDDIADGGRYYHHDRAIVLQQGMLLEDERWHLWHELVHSDAGDEAWHTDAARERLVDREAGRRAMPMRTLQWAFKLAENWHAAAALLKLPEVRVRWYVEEVLGAQGRAYVMRAAGSQGRASA